MQTQATTVGLYWRHMVVRCKLPQHDTSRYSKHDNTSRGNKKRKSKMVTYSWPWSMMSGPYPYLKTLINESKNQKRLAFRCFCAKPYLWKDVDNTWALVCEGGLLQHQTQVSGARYFHCLWAPELAQCIAVKKKWIVLWYLHINECSMRLPPSLCPNCVDPCRGSCEQPWWHVLTFWAALQLWRQGREHMKKWGFDGTWWRNGTCRTDAHRLWLCWYTAVSWKQKKIISDWYHTFCSKYQIGWRTVLNTSHYFQHPQRDKCILSLECVRGEDENLKHLHLQSLTHFLD